MEPEPADRVARVAREMEFDLICGVGGDSVLDIAKIASVMATNPGETRRYVGVGLVQKPGLPKVFRTRRFDSCNRIVHFNRGRVTYHKAPACCRVTNVG